MEQALNSTNLQLCKGAITSTKTLLKMRKSAKLKIRYHEINFMANESIIEQDSPTYLDHFMILTPSALALTLFAPTLSWEIIIILKSCNFTIEIKLQEFWEG